MSEGSNPGALAIAIAGFSLPSRGARQGFDVPPETWPLLLRILEAEKLTGLAVAAADRGWLRLSESQAEELIERHRGFMVWALAIERTLLQVGGALDQRAIEFLVLKGPSLAHTVYPDPSWRPFGDLDLLVRTSDWRSALETLDELGFRRRLPEPRAGFDERFGKAAAHVAESGLEVDLHRTLVLGPFGLWMSPEELFERTAQFRVGDRTFRRLDDTSLLLHVCMHTSLGFQVPLMLPQRDIAQVSTEGEVDWEAFGDLTGRWRLRAVVQHAARAMTETLGVPLAERAEAQIMRGSPTRGERRALLAYTTPRRKRGGMAISTLRAIPGVRAKVAFVGSLLFPARTFLSARGRRGGAPTYRKRWGVALRWVRPAGPGARR